jgi:hypothetical protein
MLTPSNEHDVFSGFGQPTAIVTPNPASTKYRYAHNSLLNDKDILIFFVVGARI